jgi:hypothetical protein
MTNASMMNSSSAGRSRDPFERAIRWYGGLARAGRWGVAAGVLMGGFLLLDSVVWPMADALNSRADRYESLLTKAAARAEELPPEVVDAALAHGAMTVPTSEEAGKEKLTAAIAEVFKKRSINLGQDVRPAQVLPQTVLPKLVAEKAPGGRMGKSVAEIRFEGTPEQVMGILTDLEGSEAVDAIGDLRMNYNAGTKRVSVQMSLEKWGVIPASSRGGA